MKTKPDDTLLTLWMDGELEGKDLELVEAWVKDHPELLAERNAVQAMTASLRENIPAQEEPPYPDFFNQRILRTIEEEEFENATHAPKNTRNFWQWLSLPAVAAAMALCFYLGSQTSTTPATQPSAVAQAPTSKDLNTDLESTVYTPDSHVQADIFESDEANATVIVLTGLPDIPDDIDITGEPIQKKSNGVMVNTDREKYTY